MDHCLAEPNKVNVNQRRVIHHRFRLTEPFLVDYCGNGSGLAVNTLVSGFAMVGSASRLIVAIEND